MAGGADKAYSGVDAYIKGLKKIGSMPLPLERSQLPFDHVGHHDFNRIPGYQGFVPGDKCKEKVADTLVIGSVLSPEHASQILQPYMCACCCNTVHCQVAAAMVNPLGQVNLIRNGQETERLGQLLSRSMGAR